MRIMVNSHERSGTHFLMNTIANNFGFPSHPWIDLDNTMWLPYVPANLFAELEIVAKDETRQKGIIKSHYSADFFEGIMPALSELYHIFYIYRESEPTLRSCWQHFKDIKEGSTTFNYETMKDEKGEGWNGGPVTATYEEFVNTQPYGACLRYQYQQYSTMKARHEDHISNWLKHPEVIPVKYEDLNSNFEQEVLRIQDIIKLPLFHGSIIRPSKAVSIQGGSFSKELVS